MNIKLGVAEIQNSINTLNSQVRNLGIQRTQYQNMNNQINQTISELSAAYNAIVDAKNRLIENYSSQSADKKVDALEEDANKINALIKKLRDEILVASNNKINSVNSSIEQAQRDIAKKNMELKEEKNKE